MRDVVQDSTSNEHKIHRLGVYFSFFTAFHTFPYVVAPAFSTPAFSTPAFQRPLFIVSYPYDSVIGDERCSLIGFLLFISDAASVHCLIYYMSAFNQQQCRRKRSAAIARRRDVDSAVSSDDCKSFVVAP